MLAGAYVTPLRTTNPEPTSKSRHSQPLAQNGRESRVLKAKSMGLSKSEPSLRHKAVMTHSSLLDPPLYPSAHRLDECRPTSTNHHALSPLNPLFCSRPCCPEARPSLNPTPLNPMHYYYFPFSMGLECVPALNPQTLN